jgi:hypothetical protein
VHTWQVPGKVAEEPVFLVPAGQIVLGAVTQFSVGRIGRVKYSRVETAAQADEVPGKVEVCPVIL